MDSRESIGVVIAVFSTIVKIFPQQVPGKTHLRNATADHDHANQGLSSQIDSFSEDASHHAESNQRTILYHG